MYCYSLWGINNCNVFHTLQCNGTNTFPKWDGLNDVFGRHMWNQELLNWETANIMKAIHESYKAEPPKRKILLWYVKILYEASFQMCSPCRGKPRMTIKPHSVSVYVADSCWAVIEAETPLLPVLMNEAFESFVFLFFFIKCPCQGHLCESLFENIIIIR